MPSLSTTATLVLSRLAAVGYALNATPVWLTIILRASTCKVSSTTARYSESGSSMKTCALCSPTSSSLIDPGSNGGPPTYGLRILEDAAGSCTRGFLRAIEHGFAAPLPSFVRDELEGFIDCGVLSRGFAVLACPECTGRVVVGYSCKGLGFCPSCLGRRMAETSANLVEHVLPSAAPLRQFVLTLPFEVRARLAYDGKLLGDVCHAFVDSVLGWYRRHFEARGFDGARVAPSPSCNA